MDLSQLSFIDIEAVLSYRIVIVKPELVYVYVESEPDTEADEAYLKQIQQLLDEADRPLYFLMDFTAHVITRMSTIRRNAQLSRHPNFGASRAFGADNSYIAYGQIFATLSGQDGPISFFPDAESALASLAERRPGLADDVDVDEFLLS